MPENLRQPGLQSETVSQENWKLQHRAMFVLVVFTPQNLQLQGPGLAGMPCQHGS